MEELGWVRGGGGSGRGWLRGFVRVTLNICGCSPGRRDAVLADPLYGGEKGVEGGRGVCLAAIFDFGPMSLAQIELIAHLDAPFLLLYRNT